MHYVYMVQCADGTYYTGWTTNIENRISKHNSGKGAKYTASRRPVALSYREEFDNKSDAQKREAEIKRLSRAQKIKLIKGQNGIANPYKI